MPRPELTVYQNEVDQYFSTLPAESFEETHCLFCGKDSESVQLFEKGTMQVRRCRCGMVWNARQPTQTTLNQFYAESRAMSQWAILKEGRDEDVRQQEKFSPAVDLLVSSGVKSVADIGCGNGRFLMHLRAKNPDIYLRGTEQNSSALRIATQNGLTVYPWSLEDFCEHNASTYDAITLWGVLEHLKRPGEALRALSDHLHPGGHVVVCVPNVNSEVVRNLWAKCFTFCPQHLWYFSPTTVVQCLMNAGFEYPSDHWTIEPEVNPIRRHRSGLPPYDGAFDEMINEILLPNEVLGLGRGYKIVMIARKPG